MEYCLQYDFIQDFSLWLRTGSNPADINRFRTKLQKIKNNLILGQNLRQVFFWKHFNLVSAENCKQFDHTYILNSSIFSII